MFYGIYTTDLVYLKHTRQSREAAWGSSERGLLPGTAHWMLRAGYQKAPKRVAKIQDYAKVA
jgi:hypothetical protein